MEWLTAQAVMALLALTALEIVLGIDNVVFLAILANKLPEHQRALARRIGLIMAMVGRIVLLFFISWLMGLEATVFSVFGMDFSGRDLILLGGGLFLLGKATWEIHESLEGHTSPHASAAKVATASFTSVIAQVLLMDLVFSIDSVITAVGMTDYLWVMVTAIVIAIGVMLVFAGAIARFVERHPTMKMLALSFLLLIGVLLVAEGLGQHIERGYVYFAMGFSLFVELLNLRFTKNVQPPGAGHGPAKHV